MYHIVGTSAAGVLGDVWGFQTISGDDFLCCKGYRYRYVDIFVVFDKLTCSSDDEFTPCLFAFLT